MDYGAINAASLGKRRRPGSGWDSAAPPPMPRARRVSPLRDDEDDDAFLDESERERRDAVREMGRWSEDQLRDFLEIKGESHEDLRTHAELLRRAVDAETGATGDRHDNDDAPAPTGDAANDDDDDDDPFEAFMAGIADEVKAAPAPRPAHTAANKPTRAALDDDDDDDDPMMSFVRARASGKTTAAGTRTPSAAAAVSGLEISLANSSAAGVEDEDVYAAAAAADAAATGTQLCARPVRPGASEPAPRVDHSRIEYGDFNRDFYVEAPEISSMAPDAVEAMRRQLDLHVLGVDPPNPVERFGQCGGLNAETLKILKRLGYESPTPIQSQAIPALLSGRDVVGIAKTGSGKTAAFLLPALVHAMDQPELGKGDGPIVLALAPTRELGSQILAECKKLARAHEGLRCVGVLGGGSKTENFRELRAGAEVVVGTPGRVVDVCGGGNKSATNLARVTYLVLDEADRMLDMGFEAQVRSLCDGVRPDRQTALFSATMPARVRALCDDVLGRPTGTYGADGDGDGYASPPLTITVGRPGGANSDVAQFAEVLADGTDDARLAWLVRRAREFVDEGEVLVFCARKAQVDSCVASMRDLGVRVAGMHGDMHQSDRAAALRAFRKGETHVLVATDVAARGLDVPSVRTVVSLHPPRDIESHVHRIGRTGRAGNKDGRAFTLVAKTDGNARFLSDLVVNMQRAGQRVPPQLHAIAGGGGRRRWRGKGGRGKGRGAGGAGIGFDEFDVAGGYAEMDELTRRYDAGKAGEAAAAAGNLPPPPPPPTLTSTSTTPNRAPLAPRGFVPSTDGAQVSASAAVIVPPKAGWSAPSNPGESPAGESPADDPAMLAARAAAVAARINARFAAGDRHHTPPPSQPQPSQPPPAQTPHQTAASLDADGLRWRAPGVGRSRPLPSGGGGGGGPRYNAVPPPASVTTEPPGRAPQMRAAAATPAIDPRVDAEAAARMAKARAFAMSGGAMSGGFSSAAPPFPAQQAAGGMNPAAAAAARAAAAAIASRITAQAKANGHRVE